MVTVEIVTTGNEVLNGDVLDTNTNWLCKRITGIGGYTRRAVLVRDDVDAIARHVESALAAGAQVVFTVGGMGPTVDDLTLAAVAKAAGRPLVLNDEALALVRQKYEEFARSGAVDDAAITPAREKMAVLPQGALPLSNPVGAAPGVLLPVAGSAVISLPGVPAELQGIFETSLQPTLRSIFGESTFLEKVAIVDSKDESVLAPILQTVAQQYPGVYIKSRAKRFGPDVKFRVTVSAAGQSRQEVEQAVNAALQGVGDALARHGIAIDSIE